MAGLSDLNALTSLELSCCGRRPLKHNNFDILVFCLRVGEGDVYDFLVRRTLLAEALTCEATVNVEAELFLCDRFGFNSEFILIFVSD